MGTTAAHTSSDDLPVVTPVKILLVDDMPRNLLALKGILEDQGYDLLVARSGPEALRIALHEKLAVILLDVLMPGMDGFEVARHLKQVDRTSRIPIIFVTASAFDVQEIYRGYDVGAVDYLIKPLDVEVVRKKVAVFVRLFRQQEEIERQQQLLWEAERRDYELRLAELRVMGDRRYRKLVTGIDHAIGWTADEALRITFVSRQAAQILGFAMEDFVEPDFWAKHLGSQDREFVLAQFRRALAEEVDLAFTHRLVAADGRELWFKTGVSGERGFSGQPTELHGISVEVTAIKRAEETQAMLADVSRILVESVDYRSTLPSAARRLVPVLAEGCVIDEVVGPHTVEALAVAHADPGQEAWMPAPGYRRELDPDAGAGVGHVVRTGAPELDGELSDRSSIAAALAVAEDDRRGAPASCSAMFVPISARDRLLAVMTLIASPGRRFGPADQTLAELVCHRVALAIDNALLYREAERATHAREDLLGVVSHDLRNPLGALVAAAGLLERLAAPDGSLGREQVEKLARTMLRSAQRMERLIGDLLDFAQIGAGRLAIERGRVDAASLVRESVEASRSAAAEKGVRLEGIATREMPVLCDRMRVLQILSNLVDNAIKFTPATGTVVVRAEDAGTDVLFAISDSGPGIPEEELARIWEHYWQARSRPGAGIGLGLAIAKSLVEAHGGRIWAESKVGVGTTFYFTLPSGSGR